MPRNAAASLADALRRGRLLEAAQLDELVRDVQPRFPDPRALARELIRRGWLTLYQANQVLQGRGGDLSLGSYVLLEPLGEGGMGAVFKARNWKLGQVVALKLIRKERLQNADALRRFHREIRAASQLDHPNIVRAIDADEVGGTHLFVMEFVPGVDLAKHVRESGPAPVDRACDYARQAALGLQHASERGLVHRDIKPSNLLLTPQGLVKILDMGLARMQHGADGDCSGTMTTDGAIMGTLDYIAPEQAMNSHTVDVRADLYSLGCTLYFLLTGRVPFPAGEALEKLLKHRLDEPDPVERLRPDVPPGVAALVRKLMAKRPEDRFQTAGEAAVMLASAAAGEGLTELVIGAVRPVQTAPGPQSSEETDAHLASAAVTAETPTSASLAPRGGTARRIWPWVVLGTTAGVVLGLTALSLFARRSPPAPAAIPGKPAAPEPTAFDRWAGAVAILPAEHQGEAVGAELKKRNPGFDGTVKATVENGVVTGLDFLVDNVTDVTPVRALPGLKSLACRGSAAAKGRLSDLSPLQGMPLTSLNCSNTAVSDLSPLQGMPLTTLICIGTKVSELAPLKGLKLTTLDCSSTPVTDLSPLQGTPLTTLNCSNTSVSTLTPLKGLPLTSLNCNNTAVSDLSPLTGMALTSLTFTGMKVSELAPLKGMKLTVLDIHSMPISDLAPLEGMPLTTLICSGTKVSDLAPLKGMNLTSLDCRTTSVADLSPLEGMPLTTLYIYGTKVTDLAPLRGMKLTYLTCANSPVSSLSGLEGMPLTTLYCGGTNVSDLSPLKGMKLTYLDCARTPVADLAPLADMPLKTLLCDFKPERDARVLRAIPTLEKINGKTSKKFWKDVDAMAP